jgi:hypothetical protein
MVQLLLYFKANPWSHDEMTKSYTDMTKDPVIRDLIKLARKVRF